MDLVQIYLLGGLAILIYVTMVWILSLILKDAGIMDIFWGLGFILVGLIYVGQTMEMSVPAMIFMAMLIIWGVRLALHIGVRNHGKPEDARYLKWRNDNGSAWWWRSYFKVFLLQGMVMWIVSLPLLPAIFSNESWQLTNSIGAFIWMIGFTFEAVGDWQLMKFKNNPANKGKIMDSGLWRYTRHPNYFGEAILWWGFTLMAISMSYLWIVISPIIMTWLLVKGSGAKMLDELMLRTRPEYAAYIRRTNTFIPGLPKEKENKS